MPGTVSGDIISFDCRGRTGGLVYPVTPPTPPVELLKDCGKNVSLSGFSPYPQPVTPFPETSWFSCPSTVVFAADGTFWFVTTVSSGVGGSPTTDALYILRYNPATQVWTEVYEEIGDSADGTLFVEPSIGIKVKGTKTVLVLCSLWDSHVVVLVFDGNTLLNSYQNFFADGYSDPTYGLLSSAYQQADGVLIDSTNRIHVAIETFEAQRHFLDMYSDDWGATWQISHVFSFTYTTGFFNQEFDPFVTEDHFGNLWFNLSGWSTKASPQTTIWTNKVFKSTDYGASWTEVVSTDLQFFYTMQSIVEFQGNLYSVCPWSYAFPGVFSGSRVAKSTDGGTNWTGFEIRNDGKQYYAGYLLNYNDVWMLAAVTQQNPTDNTKSVTYLYTSTDGETWTYRYEFDWYAIRFKDNLVIQQQGSDFLMSAWYPEVRQNNVTHLVVVKFDTSFTNFEIIDTPFFDAQGG